MCLGPKILLFTEKRRLRWKAEAPGTVCTAWGLFPASLSGRLAPTQELRLAQTSYPLAPVRSSLPNGKDLSTRRTTCRHSAQSKPPDLLNFQNESRPQGVEETEILLLCIIYRNWNIFLSLFWNMIVFTEPFLLQGSQLLSNGAILKPGLSTLLIPGISVCKFPALRSICISVNHRQLLRT